MEEEKVKHSMVDICVITGGGCRLPERDGAEKVIECVLFVLMPRPRRIMSNGSSGQRIHNKRGETQGTECKECQYSQRK